MNCTCDTNVEFGEVCPVCNGIGEGATCSPRCDNCRWGMELEERYDQQQCINEASPEAFGNVEASFSCQFFEPNGGE